MPIRDQPTVWRQTQDYTYDLHIHDAISTTKITRGSAVLPHRYYRRTHSALMCFYETYLRVVYILHLTYSP